MKILMLSFYYYPDLSAGSFRTTALVKALLEELPEHARIELITTLPNRYSSFNAEAPEMEIHPRLTVRRIALPPHKSGMVDQAKAFLAYVNGVRNTARAAEYDLVYATSSRLMTAVLGAFLAKWYKAPLYLDIRDIFVDTIKDVLPRKQVWLFKPLFSMVEGFAIRSARKVNLVSEGFIEYFETRYPDQSYSSFTNGVDDEFVDAQPAEVLPCSDRVFEVLYAGNMGEGQGLHNIIPELANNFKGKLLFRLVGDGGRLAALQEAIEAAGCKNVEVVKPVKRAELISFYKSADILFLHLNDYEAFHKVLPSKIFEYAALGKPIWAGVSGYAARFIRENIDNAAVFSPCDVSGAISSFEKLEISTRPRKKFIERFSRLNIMQNMSKDIVSVLSKGD